MQTLDLHSIKLVQEGEGRKRSCKVLLGAKGMERTENQGLGSRHHGIRKEGRAEPVGGRWKGVERSGRREE